jgi:hypothetical protein
MVVSLWNNNLIGYVWVLNMNEKLNIRVIHTGQFYEGFEQFLIILRCVTYSNALTHWFEE